MPKSFGDRLEARAEVGQAVRVEAMDALEQLLDPLAQVAGESEGNDAGDQER